MEQRQISLTMPEKLFEVSKLYSEEFGYRSIQEFIVDLIRKKVMLDNIDKYKKIEERIKRKVGVKVFDQKGAVEYLRGL